MVALNPQWDLNKLGDQADLIRELIRQAALSQEDRAAIVARATRLVEQIRATSRPDLMEAFLAEYGLSTHEGVALMCLAEALLRVPDPITIDALIEDKIATSRWSEHLGQSSSPLVNASTWGLLLTGNLLNTGSPGVAGTLREMVKRLGEPLIRRAVRDAIRQMGRQFVLGEDMASAMKRAQAMEKKGFTYSYDMLGEAAITAQDAEHYAKAYAQAIDSIAKVASSKDLASNPGISVKLSALHPRYEVAQADRVMQELVPVLTQLARQAARAGIGFNIDAEEADRLALSLMVIEATLSNPELANWDGFGVVVQAYGRRASTVIDSLYEMAKKTRRRLMIRLVKGAYWDTEIKQAQVAGLEDFPVFTRKEASDISYIALARKLLGMTDLIYPQFATHNAHSVASILHMAKDLPKHCFEFQRLHGMGEALHHRVLSEEGTRCRIYAPVGAHRDLLAYLVRRLLENGANASFVNQIVDPSIPASKVASCPFEAMEAHPSYGGPKLRTGPELFEPERPNSLGFDLNDGIVLTKIDAFRKRPDGLSIAPILAKPVDGLSDAYEPLLNPANAEVIGKIRPARIEDVEAAFSHAQPWSVPVSERADALRRAADLFEENYGKLFALLCVEAGKTLSDAVAELREAVDFLRYYAAQAEVLSNPPRGLFTCISPWNFPLAIFTGQIAAALAAGNGVLAKPAETTPAIADWAVRLLHKAGVPQTALQLLPGKGSLIGNALTSDSRVKGVAFTGSTATARRIQRAMAGGCEPGTPLIAETGGLNAMIVDSTALPEQAIRDVIVSAFQSAGQRCSALRCLYIQEDIAEPFLKLLLGAMNELTLADPWDLATDLGPVITQQAADQIHAYLEQAKEDGRLIHRLETPTGKGSFVAPALVKVEGIEDLGEEVFGPVLHVASFSANALPQVIKAVNATGYGLTFGLHTRIDRRIEDVAESVHAGNIYANRNQIGAIVGSQPFGGEGFSGTGPKAGGPHYMARFTQSATPKTQGEVKTEDADLALLQKQVRKANAQVGAVHSEVLPGPTGELNRLTTVPRMALLCAGPGASAAAAQRAAVEALGGRAVEVPTRLGAEALTAIEDIGGLIWWGDQETARTYALALCERSGPIAPLIVGMPDKAHACLERHLCVDTTAAGGNPELLAGAGA